MFPFGSASVQSSKGNEIMVEEVISGSEGEEDKEEVELPAPEAEEETPEWMRVLLHTRFWGQCGDHGDESRADVSLFCLRCFEVVCPHCTHDEPGHRLLKVRRYVYRSVVLVKDMQELDIDVSRIQTYIVNSQKGVHLRPMRRSPQFRPHAGAPRCLTCRCWLRSAPHIFCSLSCKVNVDVEQDDFSGPEAERRHRHVHPNLSGPSSYRQSPSQPFDASPVRDEEDQIIPEAEYMQIQKNVLELPSSSPMVGDEDPMPEAVMDLDRHTLRKRPRKQAKPLRAPFF